jgi:hypothetical protein
VGADTGGFATDWLRIRYTGARQETSPTERRTDTSRSGHNRMAGKQTRKRADRTPLRGCLLLVVAVLSSCLVPLSAPVKADHDPGFVDVGDLDPALFPLLDALLSVHDAPRSGPLRSITTDERGMLLHFASLVLLLPMGQPDDATAPPLVPALLDRQTAITLMPTTAVTYGVLGAAAPRTASSSATPLLLDGSGVLSSFPAGVLPPALANPETQIVEGFHVPHPFVPMVASDAPSPHPASHAPDAITRQATDLARAGMPLREPVWIAAGAGYRLVQPFTRRVLLWDPATNEVSATDTGDVAMVAGLVPDGGAGGALLADLALRLMHVEDGIGVAIAYTTPRGTLSVSLHGAMQYPAASVMKLAILAACEDGIARGELQRDEDVDSLEEAMIVYSDNDAANTLIDFVGRMQINVVMRRIGMTDSYIGSHFDTAYDDDDGDNYLTPRESLRLMDALLGGEVGDMARIRDLLGRSEAPGSVRDALVDANLAGPLYEKRGWYDGVENDVVRLDLGHDTTVSIAIFEPDVSDIDAAWNLFADLAHLAVDVASSP